MGWENRTTLATLKRLLRQPPFWFLLGLLVFLKLAALTLYLAHFGATNDDEGFYCLISREVIAGRALYHDLFFTQMPLLPYVYGPLLRLMPQSIESGRWISCVLTLLGVLATWRAAWILLSPAASFAALALVATDGNVSAKGCQALSEPLAFACAGLGLWAMAAVVGSSPADRQSANRPACAALAGLAFAAAALTRLSMLPIPVVLLVYLAVCGTRRTGGDAWKTFTAFAITALGLLAAVVLHYALADWPRFYFSVYGWNAAFARSFSHALIVWSFFRDLADSSIPSILVVIPAFCFVLLRMMPARSWRPDRRRVYAFAVSLAAAWLICTLIHVTRRPAFSVYQFPLLPLLAVLAGWAFDNVRGSFRRSALPLAGALAVAGGVWLCWRIPVERASFSTTPAGVYAAAAPLRAAGSMRLLTVDSNVAYCAPAARLVHGYEMAEFSLMGDFVPPNERTLGGRIPAQFLRDIDSADYVVLRNYDMSWFPSRMKPALNARLYGLEPVSVTRHFGQFGGEDSKSDYLIIFRHKPGDSISGSGGR
ncbi:MAG: hypothetical protein P4L33_01800 [Capsulimonadaceae bacterium]|nr:hypothetical protein [Capsulimonadaceae bacterium]